MIINVRGTHGSGKSQVIYTLMKAHPYYPIYGCLGPRKPEAYEMNISSKKKLPTFLLGPYLTPAGGADCIQPYDLIPELITKYAERGHVLFEGVLISKSDGSVGECLAQWGKQSVLLFLDTSLEECIASVERRRAGRADDRPFNPKNLIEAHKAVARVRNTLIKADKLRVVDVSRATAVQKIHALLQERE